MKEFIQLMEEGFTERQALAILNAISSLTTNKIDIIDLLPFPQWLFYRLKQRRRVKKEGKQ